MPVLRRALAKDAGDRFSSCREMLEALEAARLAQSTDGLLRPSSRGSGGQSTVLLPAPSVRATAAVPTEARLLLPMLTQALSNPVVEVRLAAVRALALHGPKAEAAVPGLTALLDDPDVSEAAGEALRVIVPEENSAPTPAPADGEVVLPPGPSPAAPVRAGPVSARPATTREADDHERHAATAQDLVTPVPRPAPPPVSPPPGPVPAPRPAPKLLAQDDRTPVHRFDPFGVEPSLPTQRPRWLIVALSVTVLAALAYWVNKPTPPPVPPQTSTTTTSSTLPPSPDPTLPAGPTTPPTTPLKTGEGVIPIATTLRRLPVTSVSTTLPATTTTTTTEPTTTTTTSTTSTTTTSTTTTTTLPPVEPPRCRVPRPDYPLIALQLKREGTVVVRSLVDANGRVVDVQVVRTVELLTDAAVRAARAASCTPGRRGDVPVREWIEIPVQFVIPK